MSDAFNHLLHAFILAIVAYIILKYVLQESSHTAMNRSSILGAIAFMYMMFFGHGLPTHVRSI